MKRSSATRRRPAVHISLPRAARLHQLVALIAETPQTRDQLLHFLEIGLRTFYRELELLRRCGIKVKLEQGQYRLLATVEEAEQRLPFPDPQLSFAEMAELSQGSTPSAQRLAALLESVVGPRPALKSTRKPRAGRKGGSR